jgi:hypothetical protein
VIVLRLERCPDTFYSEREIIDSILMLAGDLVTVESAEIVERVL